MSAFPSFDPLAWTLRERTWQLGGFPKLMGIVNVTPDSFSDGGQFLDPARAVAQSLQLVADGADLLDIGGESTRPGATPVSADEELRRVIPVIAEVARRTPVPVSIDTTKADVARRARRRGRNRERHFRAAVRSRDGVGLCRRTGGRHLHAHAGDAANHAGRPALRGRGGRNFRLSGQALAALAERGIERERVVLDPGIGFGKTPAHNLAILEQIARFPRWVARS